MNSAGPLDKISQILVYSQNYSSHLKNLQHVKSSVDQSNHKRNAYNLKLHHQHVKYMQAIQKQKTKQLIKQNNKVVNRILQIQHKSRAKSKFNSKLQESKASITSRSFDNLMTSKNRFRAKKNKEIQIQNMKITQRITNSRNKDSFGRKTCEKQSIQIKKDLNLLGRYSQRSQSVLSDLISKSLKLKFENIPFLPQIISKNIKNKGNKTKIAQQKFIQNIEELDQLLIQNSKFKNNRQNKYTLKKTKQSNLSLNQKAKTQQKSNFF